MYDDRDLTRDDEGTVLKERDLDGLLARGDPNVPKGDSTNIVSGGIDDMSEVLSNVPLADGHSDSVELTPRQKVGDEVDAKLVARLLRAASAKGQEENSYPEETPPTRALKDVHHP